MHKKTNNIKMLCFSGVMAAMFVGLDFLAVAISAPFGGTLKISFSALPIIIVAIFGGPFWGATTGFVGSFIAQLLTYGLTATTALWMIPDIVRGLIMGWLFRAFKCSTKKGILILETSIASIVATILNTGAMLVEQKLYGYYQSYLAIYVAVPTRTIVGIVTAIIIAVVLPTIVNALRKQNLEIL